MNGNSFLFFIPFLPAKGIFYFHNQEKKIILKERTDVYLSSQALGVPVISPDVEFSEAGRMVLGREMVPPPQYFFFPS